MDSIFVRMILLLTLRHVQTTHLRDPVTYVIAESCSSIRPVRPTRKACARIVVVASLHFLVKKSRTSLPVAAVRYFNSKWNTSDLRLPTTGIERWTASTEGYIHTFNLVDCFEPVIDSAGPSPTKNNYPFTPQKFSWVVICCNQVVMYIKITRDASLHFGGQRLKIRLILYPCLPILFSHCPDRSQNINVGELF